MQRFLCQCVVMVMSCVVSWNFFAGNVFAADNASEEEMAAVRQALKHYDQTILKQDVSGYEQLLIDDYVLIDYDGSVVKKSGTVEAAKAGDYKMEIGQSENVTVRIYGTTAITTGDWRSKGSYKGKAFNRLDRFTTVFIKESGRWRVASDHVTVVKNL